MINAGAPPEPSFASADAATKALPWKRVLQVLIVLSMALTALSLALPIITGVPYSNYDGILREYFDLGREANFPTWWNSSQHLAAALLLGVTGLIYRVQHLAGGIAWLVLSAVPLAFAVDEATIVHERLRHLTNLLFVEHPFAYAWVAIGIPLALGVGTVVAFSAWRLPQLPRRLLLIGFAVFFLGAIGVEILHGFMLPHIGQGFIFNLVYHVEELLEMIGASLILVAPLSALRYRTGEHGFVLKPNPRRLATNAH